MNKYIFISLLFLIVRLSVSQDFIKTKDGQLFRCKILKEDSLNLYYKKQSNPDFQFSIPKIKTEFHSYENPPAMYASDSVSKRGMDTLSFVKTATLSGYKYHGAFITEVGFRKLLLSDPNSAAAYEKSMQNKNAMLVFSAIGGALIGYPLGQAIGGQQNPDYALMVVGAGSIGLAIPFGRLSDKHRKRSVALFNQGVRSKTSSSALDLKLGWSANRLSLTMKF